MLGRIFVIVGGLLVIALFAALFAPYFVDWTDFRTDFERQASRIIGKKVVVHGRVEARLLPFPTVTMTDVRVGEEQNGDAIVTADSFTMESELAPFLSGEALIYKMHIVHPKVKLSLTEDGSLDWVKTGNPQIPASTVVLENVTIDDGEVLFVDQQTGRDRHLTGLDLTLSAKTLAGPWRVAGRGSVDGRIGSFVMNTSVPDAGKLYMKLRLLPDDPGIVAELEGSLSLEDLRPQYAGTFRLREKYRSETVSEEGAAMEGQKSAAPRISGDFRLLNDRLRIDKYEFQMGKPSDPYIVTGEATINAGRNPDFLLTAVGQQIDMSRFGNPAEGAPAAVSVRDRLRALLTLARDIPIPPMDGRASISLPALVAENTLTRDIRLEMRPAGNGWLIEEAEAQLPGRTTLSAKGKLTIIGDQSFSGDLLLASRQPSGFAEWVTGKVPDSVRRLKTAGFSANVEITPDLQRFEDLEIAFGAANLRGRLEHTTAEGVPPTLSTELSGNQFDLETVMALGGLLTGEASIQSVFDHQIAARLKFDRFSAFGLNAARLETAFTLANGDVSDARLSVGDFYGAEIGLKGNFANVADGPLGKAEITLKSGRPDRLLQLIASRLPAHPASRRLAESARYYEGSDFKIDLSLGKGEWPIEAKMTGVSHGSRLAANLAAQSLDLVNSGGLVLDATIQNPDAWVMLGQAGLQTLQIDADQDGIVSLHVEQPAEADPQVQVAYRSGTTTVTLEGQTALDGQHFLSGSYSLSVDSGDLAPYLMMTGVTVPRLTEGLPFVGTASVYTTADAVTIENISGNSDGNAFTGILSLDRRRPEPLFAGEMTLSSADLAWLAESIYGQVANADGPGLSAQPVPSTTGLPVAADIALAVSKFGLGALGDVEDFRGHLTADSGRLGIANASGKFYSGGFKGNVELGNTGGNAFFRARLGISDASLETPFWKHAGLPVAKAQANLSLVIDATGTSPRSMLDTATGSGALNLRDVTLNGLDSGALPAILARIDATQADIGEAVVTPIVSETLLEGSLHLDRLDIPFAITGAKLRADKVQAANAAADLAGEGTMALEDASIDAALDVTLKPGDQAMAGAEPTVRLLWSGPFAAPRRSVDMTQMTSFLSLRKFEQERRRVEILQSRMAEQQRLRRESVLYRSRAAERQRQKELEEGRRLDPTQQGWKDRLERDGGVAPGVILSPDQVPAQ